MIVLNALMGFIKFLKCYCLFNVITQILVECVFDYSWCNEFCELNILFSILLKIYRQYSLLEQKWLGLSRSLTNVLKKYITVKLSHLWTLYDTENVMMYWKTRTILSDRYSRYFELELIQLTISIFSLRIVCVSVLNKSMWTLAF